MTNTLKAVFLFTGVVLSGALVEASLNQVVMEKSEVNLKGSVPAGASDVNWTQLSGPDVKAPVFTAPEVHSAAPHFLSFELSYNDNAKQPQTQLIYIMVLNANQAPVADAGPSSRVEETGVVVLDGSKSSDPDGDTLSYLWTQVKGQPVQLSNPRGSTALFVAPQIPQNMQSPLYLTFLLTVNDGQAIHTQTVSAMVTPAEGGLLKPQDRSKSFQESVLDQHREGARKARLDYLAKTEFEQAQKLYGEKKQEQALRSCEKVLMLKPTHEEAATLIKTIEAEQNAERATTIKAAHAKFEEGDYLGVIRHLQKMRGHDEFMAMAVLALETAAHASPDVPPSPPVPTPSPMTTPAPPPAPTPPPKKPRDSRRSRLLYLEGLSLYAQGKLNEASQSWKKAVTFDPGNRYAKEAFHRVTIELKEALTQ